MTFEPYAVQCTTCNSRLRVTDPAIIGTIASCPSCQSMVEISAPITKQGPAAQQVAVGSSSVDSGAITEEAINADPGEVVDPSEAPQGFTTDSTIAEPHPDADLLGSSTTTESPLPPQWQSDRTKRSRQIAMVVSLAASGLLGAILLFGWFVKNWNAEKVVAEHAVADVDPANGSAQVQSPNPTAESTEPTDLESASADAPPSNDPQTNDPQTNDPAADASAGEEPTAKVDLATDTKPQIDAPGLSAPGISAPGITPPSSPEMPADIPTNIPGDLPTDIPGGLIQSSPLDNLDTPQAIGKTDDNDADAADPAPTALPAEMNDLIQIFDMGGDQPLPAMDAPEPIDIEIDGAAEETVDPMMIANPPEPINFRRDLSIEIALSSKGGTYPFSDLMLFLSQVSGVPIQIDWVTFDLVGINIRDAVRINRKKDTVGNIIDEVAESLGASVKQEKLMLTIAPKEEKVKEKLAELLDLSEFGDGQLSAIRTLNAFFVGNNNPGANAKTLQVGETRGEQQIAAFAVEAMRRIRNVPPKIQDRVYMRWAQSASNASLDWPIVTGGESGQQINSPIAVAGMLRRLSRQNNATCFVNWFDANRRKMLPEQLVMPYMKVDAGKVLNQVLQPFELQVRRVDESHWWVGTEATYDQFPVIVWTPPLGADQAAFLQRIANAANKNKAPSKIVIDSPTGCALMLLPRFIVQQMPKLQNGLNLTSIK